jgi:hypothetical protein
MALACVLTIGCVSSSDGRGWNLVPLSKKQLNWLRGFCFVSKFMFIPLRFFDQDSGAYLFHVMTAFLVQQDNKKNWLAATSFFQDILCTETDSYNNIL